jgi:hypothetical protein
VTRYTLQSRSIGITTIGLFASLGIGSFASAQPLPNEVLKFQQLPLGANLNSKFPGHDELSTANLNSASGGYSGTFAADDFSDNVSSPIVDVQWWGSYLPSTATQGQVQQFLISFETNATSTAGFSEPGQSLSSQVVNIAPSPLLPASGMFSETAVPSVPGPDGTLYQYNAELANPFPEQAGTTYWLKIVALNSNLPGTVPVQWGWHNRDYTIPDPYAAPPGDVIEGTNDNGQPVYHYLDDAVTGDVTYLPAVPPPQSLIETNMSPLFYNSTNPAIDGFGATGIAAPSEDLAFSLYYNPTVPEPVALPLLAMSFFFLRRNRRTA